MEIRTNAHIICDLLQYVVRTEWSGQRNISCHCHPEYSACCLECRTFYGDHAKDCKLKLLIDESRAFLEAENKLIEEKDSTEGYFSIP